MGLGRLALDRGRSIRERFSSPRWRWALGAAVSAGLVAAILLQLGRASGEAFAMLERLPPVAWAVFALIYLAQPFSDLAIFRRVWRLPLSGFVALLRKNVINEAVLGYGGEVYLYFWARRRTDLTRQLMGVIKDVNILSALASSTLTVTLLAVSLTALSRLDLARQLGPALWVGAALVAVPFIALLFARQVFSLPAADLRFVFGVHATRVVAVSALSVALWRLALPEVGLQACVLLLATRMAVGRLPFVANKDLLFGNAVLLLAGRDAPVAVMLAALALATLIAHLAVVALLGFVELSRGPRAEADA